MKKYFLVVFCALLLFVVTGCGNKNQVVCKATMTESGITMNAEVIGDLDNDNKIKDVTVVYDLNNSETADQYCSLFKMFEDSENGVSVSCSGSKVTIKGLSSMDISDDDEDKVIGLTKEEFIKKATEENEDGINFTCK